MTSFQQILSGMICVICLGCSGSGGGGGSDDNNATDTPPPNMPQFVTTDTVRTRSLAVCLNCHNGSVQSPDLRTAQAVKANANDIQFQVNNNRMPPSDSGFPLLSACQKEILNKWIQLGRPDSSTIPVSSLTNCPAGLMSWDEPQMEEENE